MKIEEDEIYAHLQEQYQNAVKVLIDEAVKRLHEELNEMGKT